MDIVVDFSPVSFLCISSSQPVPLTLRLRQFYQDRASSPTLDSSTASKDTDVDLHGIQPVDQLAAPRQEDRRPASVQEYLQKYYGRTRFRSASDGEEGEADVSVLSDGAVEYDEE